MEFNLLTLIKIIAVIAGGIVAFNILFYGFLIIKYLLDNKKNKLQ